MWFAGHGLLQPARLVRGDAALAGGRHAPVERVGLVAAQLHILAALQRPGQVRPCGARPARHRPREAPAPPAAAPPCSLHAACRTRAACLLGAEPCFPRRPAPPHAAPVSARRQPACVLKTGRCCSAQPGQPDQPWFAGVAGRSAYVERPRDGRCALHLLPTGGYVRASPAEPPRPGV